MADSKKMVNLLRTPSLDDKLRNQNIHQGWHNMEEFADEVKDTKPSVEQKLFIEEEPKYFSARSIREALKYHIQVIIDEYDGRFISEIEQERSDSILIANGLNQAIESGKKRPGQKAASTRNKRVAEFYNSIKDIYQDTIKELTAVKGKASDNAIAKKFNEMYLETFEEGHWHSKSIGRLRKYYDKLDKLESEKKKEKERKQDKAWIPEKALLTANL